MNKKWLLFGTILLCFILSSTTQQASAEEISSETYTQNLSKASLSGFQATHYQYFEIEDYWKVDQAELYLEYNFSSLLNVEKSSITLSANGTPFYSFRPAEEHREGITIAIPTHLLTSGMNALTIEGKQLNSTDEQLYNVCDVTENNNNWFTISDHSSVSVSYETDPMKPSIAQFFSRFVGLDTVKLTAHGVVVSQASSSAELESAIYSLAGLAKAKSDADHPIPLLVEGDEKIAQKQYAIYVGHYDELPERIKSSLGIIDVEQRALLKLVELDQQHVLVVTSKNEEMLIQAGRYVANQDLMMQTIAREKWIDAATNVMTPAIDVSRIIKLTETGDQLVGPAHREKSYFITLPANQSIAEASKIRLDMRYSQNLNFNRSLVTVLINNKPIGSKKLSEITANQDVLELPIPKNLDVNGNFTVTVAFDLEIESMPCTANQEQMPWAYVDSSSILQLNTVDRHDLLFNYYPSNFMRNGGFNSVAVVLPEQLATEDYAALSNIFHLLGRYAQTNHGELQVYPDNAEASLLENKQLLVIGSYENNQLIRQLNDQFYFKYDANGDGFVSNEKKSIEDEYGKKIGVLQLLPSPFSEGFGMLVVSGSAPQYYELASELLVSESKLWQLYGDGIIADLDGQISAYRFKEEAEPPVSIINISERKDVLSFVLSAMVTIFIALAALLLLTRKYWRKRRKNDEAISKQLYI